MVGELASYLDVNRRTPNLGARVSILDQKSNLIARLDRGEGPGVGAGQFISPHSIAFDSRGDMYVGEVVATDWREVFPDQPTPRTLRRFQKFERVGGAA